MAPSLSLLPLSQAGDPVCRRSSRRQISTRSGSQSIPGTHAEGEWIIIEMLVDHFLAHFNQFGSESGGHIPTQKFRGTVLATVRQGGKPRALHSRIKQMGGQRHPTKEQGCLIKHTHTHPLIPRETGWWSQYQGTYS